MAKKKNKKNKSKNNYNNYSYFNYQSSYSDTDNIKTIAQQVFGSSDYIISTSLTDL